MSDQQAALLIISLQCVVVALLLLFLHRISAWTDDVRDAKQEIAEDVADAKRSYDALQVTTQELVQELYRARRTLYPPRQSPPNGTPTSA